MTEQNKAVEAQTSLEVLTNIRDYETIYDSDIKERALDEAIAALSHTATSEVEPVGLRDAANGLLHFFPLEEGENERGCRFGDAVADLRDALSSTPTPTHDSGLAGELVDAQKAIDPTAPTKDIALQQAIAWFDDYTVLHTSKQTPDGERKAQTNKERADYLRTALQSNSDSELLREAVGIALDGSGPIDLAAWQSEEGTLGHNRVTTFVERMRHALARLEQGAA